MWNQGQADFGGSQMNTGGGFGSPAPTGKTQRRLKSLMPCTCAMARQAQQAGDKYVVGDIELSQITLLGQIVAVNEGTSYIEYEIDDHSGPTITAKQFLESDDGQDRFREGIYVRVFGALRTFQNKQSMVAFKLRGVKDMNELTLHMIQVVHAHAMITHGSKGGMETGVPAVSTGGTAGAYTGASDTMGGLSPIQAQVQKVIAECVNEQGVSVPDVCGMLRGIPEPSIREAVEFLSSEGHIYSTIDDNHFRSTDC